MNILSFSYCFPNKNRPTWGIFVFQRLKAISNLVNLKLYSPVPWFPIYSFIKDRSLPTEENWDGLQVFRPRFFYFPKFLKDYDAKFYAWGIKSRLKKFSKTWKPDILDAHFIWPDGVGVSILAQKFNIPYTITLRGKLFECEQHPRQLKQCISALKNADAIIAVSRGLAQRAMDIGVNPNKVFLVPNGVDKALFHPMDKIKCRRKVGLPLHNRILVTVAHLGHRKGHHEVIEALSYLPEDVKLVIVGGSAQGGTPETIKRIAQKHGVQNRIILPGPQPHYKIPFYFNAADASVLASYREGCPNVVLESLACGTPVIATDVGSVKDILPTPQCGFIVPPREVHPLRQALSKAIETDWDRGNIINASNIKGWDEVGLEVVKIFQKIKLK